MKKQLEIISTEQYLVVVSDEELKVGDWVFDDLTKEILYLCDKESYIEIVTFLSVNKIIAHLPLNNSPVLDGVPLLPELPNEDVIEDIANKLYPNWHDDYDEDTKKRAFIKGYKTNINLYSEDDLQFIKDTFLLALSSHKKDTDAQELMETMQRFITWFDNFRSLKQKKYPKQFPKQFNPEWEDYSSLDTEERMIERRKLNPQYKTTTNKDGLTQLLGEYVYQ